MQCQKCGEETFMPFQCIYCGDQFCVAHRLPENHDCPRIEQARAPKQQAPNSYEAANAYEYTITYNRPSISRKSVYFSPKELKHLAIAGALIVLLGVFSWLYTTVLAGQPLEPPATVIIIILTLSFFLHEFAHKITAQREGLWAEFRLTLWGSVLTLITAISPLVKIFAPGAVMISGMPTPKSLLKISVAGPATNIVLAVVFLILTGVVPDPYSKWCLFGVFWNAFIAAFNLIPMGLFDGLKIFRIHKGIWALIFAPAVALTLLSSLLIY